jgi:hypothetical protein
MRRKCNDLEVGTGGVQEERTWMANSDHFVIAILLY